MADGEGGGGEGGGSSECLPMDDLVEAMLRNSQALAEALAADRARREAADRIQRESWEAALKEKDAEIDRLRAEVADAKKKLQADASRKMRWEAAYELLLGANQKLAELRDADMEDSRTCAETPNSKEVERCTKLSQNTMDHTASDFRKLKQAYETLSSKKDKEVSALLSEKDSVRNQLDIMRQDYAELLKNKKVESAQATEAALKLQQSVDELQQSVDEHKALAQKKDDEIGRLQAEAVGAKKKHNKELSALLSEKDSVRNQLSIMQQDYTKLLKKNKVLTQKKDHEIVILRAEAIGAKRKVQKMHSLVKEKDDEIQRLKGWHVESVQKHYKDISETHKKSRFGDPAVAVRDKLKNTNLWQTVEDHISDTKTVEKDGQDETTQKLRRASSMSNDDEMSGSDEDDDKQIGRDEDGGKQSGIDEDGDEQSRSDEDGDEQIGGDEDGYKQSGSDEDGYKQSGSDEDGDEQSRSGDDDDDGQSRSDEHDDDDGQSRSDEHDGDEHRQSGSDEEITNNLIQKPPGNPKRKRDACNAETSDDKSDTESNGVANCSWSDLLRRRRLVTAHGRRSYISTGNRGQYVSDVKDILVDQPEKRKKFDQFRWEVTLQSWLSGQKYERRVRRTPRAHPPVQRVLVQSLPHRSREEAVSARKVSRLYGKLPSAPESASAAAGLIKLKEAEQQPKREQV